MASAPLKTSPLYNLREEHFSPSMLAESEVFIETDQCDHTLMVLHKKGRVMLFQHLQFTQNNLNHFPRPDFLQEHIPMLERAARIVLSFSLPDFTLVPAQLLPTEAGEQKKLLLASGADVADDDSVYVYHPALSDYAILYTVPQAWVQWKEKLNTRAIEFIPAAASFLLSMQQAAKEHAQLALVDIREGRFMLGLVKEHQLIQLNSFPYHSTEDFLYFLLASLEHHQLSTTETPLLISGKIERSSPMLQGIHKYIKSTRMPVMPENIVLSEMYAELPLHYFHQFFQTKACVS